MICDLCHAAPGVQRRDGRLLCVECVAGWDYQAALTAEERVRDEQAIERYRQETLDEQPRTRRRRQEWRARARLTGDPERDKATRDAMLDKLHESMTAARQATADSNRELRDRIDAARTEVVVGDPIREPPAAEEEPDGP